MMYYKTVFYFILSGINYLWIKRQES